MHVMSLSIDLGCRLEFLPPYSPDLNPIELAFSVVKANLRANGALYRSYENPYWALHESYSTIGPEMAQNLFSHCGYW
jgi:transposase